MKSRRRVNSTVRRYMMLKILTIAATLLMSTVTATEGSLRLATANAPIDAVCEPISIACPTTVDPQSNITFQVFVTRAASSPRSPLKYHWSVRGFPRARIKSGQGTSSIIVSVPRRTPRSLTATVTVVQGITKGCNTKASCTTAIGRAQ
jgi:hypothetical protein